MSWVLDQAPFPPADSQLTTYLDGLSGGRVMYQECQDCGATRLPPRSHCPACGSAAAQWRESSGRGEVWALSVFHKAYGAQYRDRVPYNVAVVALEEGPRLISNIIGFESGEIKIGTPVVAETGVGDDGTPVVRFRSASS